MANAWIPPGDNMAHWASLFHSDEFRYIPMVSDVMAAFWVSHSGWITFSAAVFLLSSDWLRSHRTECCPQRRLLIGVYCRSPIFSKWEINYPKSYKSWGRWGSKCSKKFLKALASSSFKAHEPGAWVERRRASGEAGTPSRDLIWMLNHAKHPVWKAEPAKRDVAACIDWNLGKRGLRQIQQESILLHYTNQTLKYNLRRLLHISRPAE